jgi:hypothetical protein
LVSGPNPDMYRAEVGMERESSRGREEVAKAITLQVVRYTRTVSKHKHLFSRVASPNPVLGAGVSSSCRPRQALESRVLWSIYAVLCFWNCVWSMWVPEVIL